MLESIKRKILNLGAYWISYFKLMKILKGVNSSSLIIDCGANTGDISALFLARGARVIAFEPDPVAFNYLRDRFMGNKKIECINKAVSNRDGNGEFFFHQQRQAKGGKEFTVSSSLIREKINVNNRSGIEVDLIDLSSYIKGLDRDVDILKLDVEGSEIEILEKMISDKTYKRIGLILAETHETKIPGHKKEVSRIKSMILENNIQNIKLNWI